jgi:hypothetical protein
MIGKICKFSKRYKMLVCDFREVTQGSDNLCLCRRYSPGLTLYSSLTVVWMCYFNLTDFSTVML